MGGGSRPAYSKTKAFNKEMAIKEKRIKEGSIIVKDGKGRYPECLKEKPYSELCPKDTPKRPEDIPKECKFCPEHLESPFHIKRRREKLLKRLQEAGMPTKIERKY